MRSDKKVIAVVNRTVFSKLVFFHTSKTGNKILKMVNTALSNVHLYLSGKNVGKTTNAVYWTFKNVSRL